MSLLSQTHPELFSELSPALNPGLDVTKVATFSNKKVWWVHRTANGDLHQWQQIVRNRTFDGTGCSVCGTMKRVPGQFPAPKPGQSLAERFPQIATLWNRSLNQDLTPSMVTSRSVRRVWWRCPVGHEFIRSVHNMVAVGGCCSRCKSTGRRARREGLHPQVAAEWHPTKNGDLTPSDVTRYSQRKVWWLGTCGHSWRASPAIRAGYATGCPKCSTIGSGDRFTAWTQGSSASLAERHPEIAAQWHPTKNGDLTPADVTYGSAKRVWWQCSEGHEWVNTVNSRTGRGRGCWCCAYPVRVPKPEAPHPGRSLGEVAPDLAAQWHEAKNGLVTTRDIEIDSTQKVWWRCEKGHEWSSTPASRSTSRSGCRACANKSERNSRADVVEKAAREAAEKEATSLPALFPRVAAEWHPTRNGDRTARDTRPYSNRDTWWVCSEGHEWSEAVANRTAHSRDGRPCPTCSPRRRR